MFGKTHEWKNYYAVISSIQVPLVIGPTSNTGTLPLNGAEVKNHAEKKKQNKKLFRSSTDQPMVYVGQLLLYDKKNDAKFVKKIVQISESYLVWPSSAAMGDLSDGANVLRVEGIVIDGSNVSSGTSTDDQRNSSLFIDKSVKLSLERNLRHSDSKESLAKASMQVANGATSETFYLRFADSWDACQWNAAFMATFHTDADLYERDRQLRDGQVGLVDDPFLNANGNTVASSSPRSSLINRDSLPSLPPLLALATLVRLDLLLPLPDNGGTSDGVNSRFGLILL